MSAQTLITQLTELTTLHERLAEISEEKTESIKSNDMEVLTKLLIDERKIVQTIEKLEQKREKEVDRLYDAWNISSNERTVEHLLTKIEDENAKRELEDVVTKLINVIVSIRESEQLNSDLLQQSMQFVQLSLDLLQPTVQSVNYDEKHKKQQRENQSIFDSRA